MTAPVQQGKSKETYAEWLKRNKVTDANDPRSFYDYPSAYKAGVNRDPRGHFPDTYKLPGHPTFSNESVYADSTAPMWAAPIRVTAPPSRRDSHDALFENLQAVGSGPTPHEVANRPKPRRPLVPTGTGAYAVRPDPTTFPRGPHPRTIPYFFVKEGENAPLGERLHVASIPDPMEPILPLPKELFGSVHLGPGKVPEALQWQAPFLDTLTQIVGHEPGTVRAEPDPGPHSWGEFYGPSRAITLGGRMLPPDYFKRPGYAASLQGVPLAVDTNEVRISAAHEWGHLLTEQEDPILQAFIEAAPLPKKLRNDPTLGNLDFNKWPSELVATEAFADMFAATLGKHLPVMKSRPEGEYPFTPQFRSRSRQKMVDSLVNVFLKRIEP